MSKVSTLVGAGPPMGSNTKPAKLSEVFVCYATQLSKKQFLINLVGKVNTEAYLWPLSKKLKLRSAPLILQSSVAHSAN